MKKLILSLAVAAVAFGAGAADAVTAAFAVNPPMTCVNCENKIKTNLRYEKGVKKIVTSLKDKKVTITYDPAKTSPEQLIKGFRKVGYTATEIPVAAKANKAEKTETDGATGATSQQR